MSAFGEANTPLHPVRSATCAPQVFCAVPGVKNEGASGDVIEIKGALLRSTADVEPHGCAGPAEPLARPRRASTLSR